MMYVESEDWRPPTALGGPRLGREEVVVGAVTAVAVPALFVTLVALFAVAAGVLGEVLGLGEDEPPFTERQVVEARFVQLGKKPDPDKLPDRQVPLKRTAPRHAIAPTKNPQERDESEKEPPPDATEDLTERLLDRAQAFSEIAEQREREGDPEGIEEGTAREARAGDLYAGKLYAFFRRGWTVPTVIGDEERRELITDVDVTISEDLRVTDFRVRGPSGNPLFDQSVIDRLEQIRQSGAQLPEPPEEIAGDYLGRTIGLRFRGRDA